jgi:hypothetical protein
MYLSNVFLCMILFNLRLCNYLFVVCIMKLSVSQKELSKTVKLAVRTSFSKIEVITARGSCFRPLLLYRSTPNRYEGNIKMYVKWHSLETMCSMCWVRIVKFREFEQVLLKLVFRAYCKFERNSLYDILGYHVVDFRHLSLWNTKLRFLVDRDQSFGGIFGHHLCGRILDGRTFFPYVCKHRPSYKTSHPKRGKGKDNLLFT